MCILVTKIKDGHANISHSMLSAIYIYTTIYYYKTTRNKIKNMPRQHVEISPKNMKCKKYCIETGQKIHHFILLYM